MKYIKVAILMILSLFLLTLFSPAFAQEDDKEEKREILEEIVRELSDGNVEILNTYVAEDYVVHSPFGDLNRDAVAGLFAGLSEALTDFSVEREQILVDGNLAATRTTISGVFENDFNGPMGLVPPTGQPFEWEVINIFLFDEDGMIIEEWVQFDNLAFMTQLGIAETPAE